MSLQRKSRFAVLICLFTGIFIVTIIIRFHEKFLRQRHDDCQQKILHENYQFEFNPKNSFLTIDFQLKDFCQKFRLHKKFEHRFDEKNLQLFYHGEAFSVEIRLEDEEIFIETPNRFRPGNYSLSLPIHFNLTDSQRIFVTDLQTFPHFSASSFKLNVNVDADQIVVANVPLNQSISNFTADQIAFAVLRRFHCRSTDFIQICLTDHFSTSVDFHSHLFYLINKTILTFENYFSQNFPWKTLSFVSIDEFDRSALSFPGLVFVDQNQLIFNASVEQLIDQRTFISHLIAKQYFETLKFVDKKQRWFRTSLSKSLGQQFAFLNNETTEKTSLSFERHMSSVLADSLCKSTGENDRLDESILIEKVEVFLTEYRFFIGDEIFRSRIQNLIFSSNQTLSNISTFLFSEINASNFLALTTFSGHPRLFLNRSLVEIDLFQFESNCSETIPKEIYPINFRFINDSSFSIVNSSNRIDFNESIPLMTVTNPFIQFFPQLSSTRLIDEIKSSRFIPSATFLNRLLFDAFLFNLANQVSIDYPLDLLKFVFQYFSSSSSSSHSIDWSIVHRIVHWYRLMIVDVRLNEKFSQFLRTILQPLCPNQFWSKYLLSELKISSQQFNDEILFDLCCSINHSICLQYLSNNVDPQILLQSIFHSQLVDSTLKNLSINANRSFLLYSDRFVRSVVCQIVRQQNDKYWYELIELVREKSLTPSIIDALACALRTDEQIDFYLSHFCSSTSSRWFCLTNILRYAPVQIASRRLNDIDDEHWPNSNHHFIDFLFVIAKFQDEFTNKTIIRQFRSLLTNWMKKNEQILSQWFQNQHA